MLSEITYLPVVTPSQLSVLACDIRIPERDDFLRSFATVEEGLEYCWRSSKMARLVMLGDEPVAMFGVADDEKVQVPWMVMTQLALMEHPIRVMREAKRWWAELTKAYPGPMMNYVPAEDGPAQSMLEVLGFEIFKDTVVKRGEHDYYVFWWRGDQTCASS